MTTLFLDLSGKQPRALLAEGDRVIAAHTLAGLSPPRPEAVGEVLAQVAGRAGVRIDRAHLIVPDRDVATSTYKLQEMPLADAEKIILRRLGAASGVEEPLFRLTALEMTHHQQSYLAEQLDRQTVTSYLKGFTEARIRLKTITTPLQATLAALAPLRQEMLQPQAVFNIDGEAVTALFLSSAEILHYSRTPIPASEEEAAAPGDAGRLLKRKLFGILNLLHGIYSQYMLDNPRFHMGKVWLCGAEAGIDGLPQSLADAMDIEVALLSPLPEPAENSQAFAALAGLLHDHDSPERVNFIPDDVFKPMRLQPRLAKLAAGALYATVAVILVVTSEGRVAALKSELRHAGQQLKALEASAPGTEALAKNLDVLKQLDSGRIPFHELLRDLAEHLPDEVLLDGIRYLKGADRGTLELVMVTADSPEGNKEAVFSAITGALDRSPYLAGYADPVIAMIREGETRLIQVTIVCTLPPAGGDRR